MCHYRASVEAREGCPRECARDAVTGAVCGGEARGVCAVAAAGGPRCECAPPRSGPACELEGTSHAASASGASGGERAGGARALLMGILSLVLAGSALRRLGRLPALLACAALFALAVAPSHFFDAAHLLLTHTLGAMSNGQEASLPRAPGLPAANSHLRVLFAAANDGPLRRHAILLTGAIRDLTLSFPTLLQLLGATPGGFDVYAVLSPTRGGWKNADQGEAEDEAALTWLRELPAADPRVSLQLLAYDTTPSLGHLTEELRTLFPGYDSYDFKGIQNPGMNLLLELKKLQNAWDFLRARCEGGAAGAASPPQRTARGQQCYDMLVRARPDIRWLGSGEPAFALGLDVDRLWDAWGGGESPFTVAVPWVNGSALVWVSQSPPPPDAVPSLRAGGAACLHSAELRADGGPYAYLPFFGAASGNNYGGPNDVFLMGPWETMQLYFPRAPLIDALVKAGVGFHPETMVRCGMMELLRQAASERRESGKTVPVLEHVILGLHYCRLYGGAAAACF